jgi:hypothetical protein
MTTHLETKARAVAPARTGASSTEMNGVDI